MPKSKQKPVKTDEGKNGTHISSDEGRAQFFGQIADPVRHAILSLLMEEQEISVTDILTKLDKPQTLISYHLRCLKEIGLVNGIKSEDDGRKTLYSLHEPTSISKLFSMADRYVEIHSKCADGSECRDSS